MSLIIAAAGVARELHGDQKRKWTGQPYIMHPMRVAGRLSMLEGVDEVMVAAAWCHDVLEDTPCSRNLLFLALRNRMPLGTFEDDVLDRVVDIVVALTNQKAEGVPRAARKRQQRDWLSQQSRTVRLIKMMDRLDNLNDLVGASPEYVRLYADESALLFYHIHEGLPKELYDEALAKVGELRKD